MLLYMDDDSTHGVLVKLLRAAGHDVAIPADFKLSGANDPVHLAQAVRAGRVVMTRNHRDFKQLHDLIEVVGGHHPGIVTIRKDNDKRDLKAPGIVKALTTFLASGNPVVDQFVILNQYR
jgi:predicted nuclease of predicted toxin-antitoxin system